MTKPDLTYDELCTVLDVLNVYNPTDIENIYPGMGEEGFMRNVDSAFKKFLNCVNHIESADD